MEIEIIAVAAKTLHKAPPPVIAKAAAAFVIVARWHPAIAIPASRGIICIHASRDSSAGVNHGLLSQCMLEYDVQDGPAYAG